MDQKKQFLLLNYLTNNNLKLSIKLMNGDKDLLKFLGKRKMREGLKYCSMKRSVIYEAILERDPRLIKKHLRVSKEAFQKLVELYPSKRHGYDPQMELGVTLFWLAAGTSYRVVSTAFNMPTTTVFNITRRSLDMILNLMKHITVLPNEDELQSIGLKFANRAGSHVFHQAVGAIDGTHIEIKCPIDRHDEYINRKLDYSIQLQAVCDAEFKILHVCIGWPGSVHDQRVIRNSDLYVNRRYPARDYYLLGNSGYQLTRDPITIITPFTENRSLTPQQKKFNHLHSKARIAVEQTFGQMKTRWRCIFLRSVEPDLKTCNKVIAVCCILHNICLNVGDLMAIDEEFQNENSNFSSNEEIYQPQISGSAFRDNLCSEI